MKYFLDTEFIENGITIDLLSIALVTDDGRSLYLQNSSANFKAAGDWVWRNVFPRLIHFDMRGERACREMTINSMNDKRTACGSECPWRTTYEIRDAVRKFCDVEKFGKPEFWGYYADYDWVAFCQLFGSMVLLPKGFPMYCRDIKQWCDLLGNPQLPKQGKDEHSAILDAHWNAKAWKFLDDIASDKINPL